MNGIGDGHGGGGVPPFSSTQQDEEEAGGEKARGPREGPPGGGRRPGLEPGQMVCLLFLVAGPVPSKISVCGPGYVLNCLFTAVSNPNKSMARSSDGLDRIGRTGLKGCARLWTDNFGLATLHERGQFLPSPRVSLTQAEHDMIKRPNAWLEPS